MFKVPVFSVKQWVQSWDQAEWQPKDGLPEPPREFYVGSVSIALLRAMSGVSHREVVDRRESAPDTGYQRPHDRERSEKVARYVKWGYPLSSQNSLSPAEFPDLIHPGWLPTAILVNVLKPGDSRRRSGRSVSLGEKDAIAITRDNGQFVVTGEERTFEPEELAPLEVIDGQHRLFAVDELNGNLADYEVPVVFFQGLTPQWQAYLFWVINVEPRKINPSLAFDLYPELRSQSWLEKGEWTKVYREHRAQELAEALWRHPTSSWYGRIELMGKRVPGHVSNAAFIRSLMASFVRPYKAGAKIGGLFGSIDKRGSQYAIPWKRAQQAALLIRIWQHIEASVAASSAAWVVSFDKRHSDLHGDGSAFSGQYSLLATDQGVRAILTTYNAALQLKDNLPLDEWYMSEVTDQPDVMSVEVALESLKRQTKIDA
ncbi:MAG: DGQHR domain-containing protein, partial [Xanthomonadales bacterium]|nr:DGQHR domain-containing protein [Xanthomonadales bacterium]